MHTLHLHWRQLSSFTTNTMTRQCKPLHTLWLCVSQFFIFVILPNIICVQFLIQLWKRLISKKNWPENLHAEILAYAKEVVGQIVHVINPHTLTHYTYSSKTGTSNWTRKLWYHSPLSRRAKPVVSRNSSMKLGVMMRMISPTLQHPLPTLTHWSPPFWTHWLISTFIDQCSKVQASVDLTHSGLLVHYGFICLKWESLLARWYTNQQTMQPPQGGYCWGTAMCLVLLAQWPSAPRARPVISCRSWTRWLWDQSRHWKGSNGWGQGWRGVECSIFGGRWW